MNNILLDMCGYALAKDVFEILFHSSSIIIQKVDNHKTLSSYSSVRVDCTPSDMIVSLSFGTPFEGRIYATGNAPACFEMGSGQTLVTLRLPIGQICGTVQQVQFIAEVVLEMSTNRYVALCSRYSSLHK